MTQVEYAKAFIMRNLKNEGAGCKSLTVKSKRTGEDYIIAQQYPTYDGWFVYEGCELVVGDVSYDYAVRVLLSVTV